MVVIFICLIVFIGICAFIFSDQKKRFNNGECPECKLRWNFFDSDSQGGRGYDCKRCGKTIWISWPFIDDKFLKEQTINDKMMKIEEYDRLHK